MRQAGSQSYTSRVVKRNHIGRTGVPEKFFIQPCHLRGGNEMDAEGHLFDFQFCKQVAHDLLEQTRVDFLRPLAVENLDGHRN